MTRTVSVLFFLFCISAARADTLFIAHLDGEQVTHPVDTPAKGTGLILLHQSDPPLITTILADYNITSPIVASHIHMGAVGIDGLVEFGLIGGDFANPVVGIWDDCRPPCHRFTPPPVSRDIPNLLSDHLYYVVHTQAYGGGENRGQIYSLPGYEVDADAQLFIAALSPDDAPGPYGPGALLVAILNSDQTEALLILSAPGVRGYPFSADILGGDQLAFPLLSPGEYVDPVVKPWSDGLPAFVSGLQNGLLTVTLRGWISWSEWITVTGPLYPIEWYPIIHP